MVKISLASTYHDPEGRLYAQLDALLPTLTASFSGMVIQASHLAYAPSLARLADAGAMIEQDNANDEQIGRKLGYARRRSLEMALQLPHETILYCDFDRILHWAAFYPDELQDTLAQIPHYDFTVIGRTQRAYDSHPRIQRDTEVVVNHVFGLVSGHFWDVTAATRGLSRQAAQALVNGSRDDHISVDASWPLFILQNQALQVHYLETEGMEFETADRFGDEVETLGGVSQWMEQRLDLNPREWFHRLQLACIEVEAMLDYSKA